MSNKLFTAIICSAEPCTEHILPDTVELLSHVSKFRTGSLEELATDLNRARIDSTLAVKTPFCFKLDADDKYEFLEVETNGITRGPDYVRVVATGEVTLLPKKAFSVQAYIEDPMLMHNCVVYNTEAVQAVCRKLPDGPYLTDWLMNMVLAAWKGVDWNDDISYTWDKGTTGMHKTITPRVYMLSRRWVAHEMPQVLEELRAGK